MQYHEHKHGSFPYTHRRGDRFGYVEPKPNYGIVNWEVRASDGRVVVHGWTVTVEAAERAVDRNLYL